MCLTVGGHYLTQTSRAEIIFTVQNQDLKGKWVLFLDLKTNLYIFEAGIGTFIGVILAPFKLHQSLCVKLLPNLYRVSEKFSLQI